MREFYVGLVYHRISHRGVYLHMAQQFLDLLHGHSFIDGHGGQRAAELVWMYARNLQATAQLPEAEFNTCNLEPFVWFVE